MADETEREGLSEVEIALIDALKVGYRDGDEVMQETASEGKPMNDRTQEIKQRAAEIAAEFAEKQKQTEDTRSAIIELGKQNLAEFRKKVDDAGFMQILGENPKIKVQDHSHAFAFHLGRAEYAVFADWDNGKLCREVGVEGGERRPRTTDFDQDEALNEMTDTLARMLAALQIAADD